jgi:hypothetical protein
MALQEIGLHQNTSFGISDGCGLEGQVQFPAGTSEFLFSLQAPDKF